MAPIVTVQNLGKRYRISRKPSETLTSQMAFTPFVFEDVGALIDQSSPDLSLFSSDYPHIDSTLAAPDLIRGSVAALTPQRQAAVLGENARVLFGL